MQPRKLGRYEIVKELGRGAMGTVYLAHDPEIDREVAIKTVQIFEALPESERAEARARFLREARAAGKLLNPGIVTIFDVGEADGLSYLAMEYLDGTSLDAYVRPDQLLPIGEVVELVSHAAEALDYAHGAGVVHRDIKPANLMRVGDGVKIMDFGLARGAEGQLTQDGALMGTPAYMSPEQIRGEALDGRSDLFSLGSVLYELLTGEKPFPGDTISSIIYRVVHEEARDGSKVHPRLTPALDGFLRRALAKSIDRRFADGASFAAALREAAAPAMELEPLASAVSAAIDAAIPDLPVVPREPDAGEVSGIPPAHARRPHRASPMPFVLGILAVTLVGIAGYWIYGKRAPSGQEAAPAVVWLETRVRTEPPGLEVQFDGIPLDPQQAGIVRFRSDPPFGTLTAQSGCRLGRHELSPGDAGGEVVLVADPTELDWPLELDVTDLRVRLNGEKVAPAGLRLDLCRENAIELQAAGYVPSSLAIPAQATPLEARKLLSGIELQPIPQGKLVLNRAEIELVYYVDGRRLKRAETEVELFEGEHEVRIKNEAYFIDQRQKVQIRGGRTTTPDLTPPPLTTLVVQAFPANCSVHLRRPRGKWRFFDDTPARRQIAVGSYEVRVTLKPTGESKERSIELVPGENPPVRVAFGRS